MSCHINRLNGKILKLFSLILMISVFLSCSGEKSDQHELKHVILISMDTARFDHFGCYDNPWIKTPNIDQLASKSVLLRNYNTVVTTTLASHVSLFTGKYPHHHGTPRNGFMVNPENMMLPEILKSNGYHTAGFLGSFALESRFDFNQGFDHFDENFDELMGLEGRLQSERSGEKLTDAVMTYLDSKPVPENLFLFLHYFDPHAPYRPPAPFDTMYTNHKTHELYDYLDAESELDIESIKERCLLLTGTQNHELLALNAQKYAGEISYMDQQIGRLIDYLRERGILEKSILIITSDHGENLWDHQPHFDHGLNTYRSCMQNFCLIRLPDGLNGGKQILYPVQSIDIYPSLLKYLNLKTPETVDGKVFDFKTLAGFENSRPIFCEATKPHDMVETDPRWLNINKNRCVLKGRYKFIFTPFLQVEELYDLQTDPHEQSNLLLGNPSEQIEQIKSVLMKELVDWSMSADPLPSEFNKSQYEDTVKKLKALGYM